MKLIEITTCELCPYRTHYVCTHEDNTIQIDIDYNNIPELCPLPDPQEYQISQDSLAGIFYILAHDMSVDFVEGAKAMDKHNMKNTYRDALLKMIEWAEQNGMCIEDRLRNTLYYMDNPDEEI